MNLINEQDKEIILEMIRVARKEYGKEKEKMEKRFHLNCKKKLNLIYNNLTTPKQ